MKKVVFLSSILASTLFAVTIDKVVVSSQIESEKKSISSDEIKVTKQLDIAEVLSQSLPEISLVRASGVGSDIILRGFKKDNINVLIDGAKIYGACPNRMDPPSMHISSSEVESIEVNEGAFDVENFGSLAGVINVKTKEPKERLNGEVNLNVGSFGYKKGALNLGAGSEKVKLSIAYSYEDSDQYKDGNGNTIVEQIDKVAKNEGDKYKDEYRDAKSFERENISLKSTIKLSENQNLKLFYLRDDAKDVLYPAFGMDAQVDKTDMINAEYNYRDFSIKYYHSKVEHEMGTEFRKSSNTASLYRTHKVESKVDGLKIKKDFNFNDTFITIGLDGSDRNWYGRCLSEPEPRNLKQVRIPDVTTENRAIFAKANRSFDNLNLSLGLRYDNTKIFANESVLNSASPMDMVKMAVSKYYKDSSEKDFKNISANLVTKYDLSNDSSIFLSLGQSVRVPDAKEMYFIAFMNGAWKTAGNPNLNETINREVDFGFETMLNENTNLKATAFYSNLKDFIYMHKVPTDEKINATFSNIDAEIYGFDLSLFYALNDEVSFDIGLAYQRGVKKDSIENQNDNDLAEIPPLKSKFAINYEKNNYFGTLEVVLGSKQKDIDSDNGEKEIDSYSLLNLRAGYQFNNHLSLSAGVDNLTDETYAINNSYIGRGLIASNPTDVMVINESGRYFYTNLNYKF